MFSCFTCGTDSLTNKLLKKSLKSVKPKTKKALTAQQGQLRLPAQPHGATQETKQTCAQPSCLGTACSTRPLANRAIVHPDSPIQQGPGDSSKQLLRDRADPAQLQLARESFINALTSALEVASRDKDLSAPSEVNTPTAGSSGPSSPTSRTLSLQRSLSGDNSDDASSGDESEGHHSHHGSTHDSCGSWNLPAASASKAQKGFVVVQVPTVPAVAEIPSESEIVPETLSNQPAVVSEPNEATRLLRVRTAFESFKNKRAELKDVEHASPKEVRDAAEEVAWAKQAMQVSKQLQAQLPNTGLPSPMQEELAHATAELEAEAIHTLSESDSDDDHSTPRGCSEDSETPRRIMNISPAEQAEIEAMLAGRPANDDEVRGAFTESIMGTMESLPTSPQTPTDVQTPRANQADFARIADTCLTNIRTMAACTAIHLEQDHDLMPTSSLPVFTSPASKLSATCSAGIANSTTSFPQPTSSFLPAIRSCPQSAAQACCSGDSDADEPVADASQLTCICSMIAELQLSDVLRCPKCQPRPGMISSPSLSAQKPPRHPGRAYRAASLQRLRVAALC